MFKKIAILTAWCTLAFSEPIDAIALVVEGEPITLLEIKALQKSSNLTKTQALDKLIAQKIQEAELKKVTVTEEEIDAKISQVLSQNGITMQQLHQELRSKGISFSQYRESIRKNIQKEKFIQQHLLPSIPEPSKDELKLYYLKHKKRFSLPEQITAIRYFSQSPEPIKTLLRSKKGSKLLSSEKQVLTPTNTPPAIYKVLARIPSGHFSPPATTQEGYIVYKILRKRGSFTPPYNAIQEEVQNDWKRAKHEKILEEYFQKKRTNARIEKIREI